MTGRFFRKALSWGEAEPLYLSLPGRRKGPGRSRDTRPDKT